MKGFFIGLLCVIALFAFGWAVQGNAFFMYKFFAPKVEAVRRETFEQSKAYNQGMIQELQNMQFQYVQANDDAKGVLASVILHRTADYDVDKLPPDLSAFVLTLRNQRTGASP